MFCCISTGAYITFDAVIVEYGIYSIAINDIKCVGIEDSLFDCSIDIVGVVPQCYRIGYLICRSKLIT